jgi:hypothetical protein
VDELRCSGRVISFCSTSDTCHVKLVTNPVINLERGKDREVFTTSGTYPWSFVTQIFHNGQPILGQGNYGVSGLDDYQRFNFMCPDENTGVGSTFFKPLKCSRNFFYSNFPRESNDSKLTFPDQRIKNSSLYLWINRCMIY